MKKLTHILLITSFLFAGKAFAQSNLVQENLKNNHIKTKSYLQTPPVIGKEKAYLAMPFGSAAFSDRFEVASLKGKVIEQIEYVHTNYAKTTTFSQSDLDKKRLNTLQQFLPEVFDNPLIYWSKVTQTKSRSAKEGRQQFHGFVITYRPTPTKATMAKEIEYLEKLIAGEKVPTTVGNNITICPVDEQALYVVTGAIEYTVDREVTTIDMAELATFKDSGTVVTLSHSAPPDPVVSMLDTFVAGTLEGIMTIYTPVTTDSIVTNVLNRNNWKDMLVITDVTGSMSPYTAQWMTWLKLNFKKRPTKMHVFFNDGNWTYDRDKVAGKTGGIYTVEANTEADIYNTAFETMRNGGGSDMPENNIEATLRGIEQCSDCGDVVMIADNWATPRDLAFLNQVKRPVKVIVCGSWGGINTKYLDLARATGGSVHTMEEDLTNLAKLSEGETINIGTQKFIIKNGKFTPTR
jgi:hypothetical protein